MVILNQLQSEDLKIYLHKISQYVYTATIRIRLDVCKLNVKSQPHVLKFDTAWKYLERTTPRYGAHKDTHTLLF